MSTPGIRSEKPCNAELTGWQRMRAGRLRRALMIALALCPPLVCACLAATNGRWDLFERSGAITTAVGLLLASRRHLRHGVFELAALQAHGPERDLAEIVDDILTAKLGLALSAFGTIIWGWGQYLGWWSFSYLVVWAAFAAWDACRDSNRLGPSLPIADRPPTQDGVGLPSPRCRRRDSSAMRALRCARMAALRSAAG